MGLFTGRNKEGKEYRVNLLKPSEKCSRFIEQLKDKVVKETGKVLSKEDEAYRKGYIASQTDNKNAWNYRNNRAKYEADKAKAVEYHNNKKQGGCK